MHDLVSVLIPAFNAEEWIAETLRSAVAQSWPNIEIIVVDDGSTDRTLAVAKRFECERLVVVSQRNQGAAAARNEALRLSRGRYIQWLDADDLLSPDKIELQMRNRGTARTLLSAPWAWFLHRPERAKFTPDALWADLTPAEWLIRKLSLNLHMQTATWLVSRELTHAAGPWDTRLLGDDDGEYFCRVLLASDGIRFVKEGKVYYRSTGRTSLSYIGMSERKVRAHWISMLAHIQCLRSLDDSARARQACVTYLQNWLFHFYPEYPAIVREAEMLASSLGGRLRPPRLSWKYSWISTTFGWSAAKRVQGSARNARWTVQRSWDRALLAIQESRSS